MALHYKLEHRNMRFPVSLYLHFFYFYSLNSLNVNCADSLRGSELLLTWLVKIVSFASQALSSSFGFYGINVEKPDNRAHDTSGLLAKKARWLSGSWSQWVILHGAPSGGFESHGKIDHDRRAVWCQIYSGYREARFK